MKRRASLAEEQAGVMAEKGTPTPRRSARLAGRAPETASEMASPGGSSRKRKMLRNDPDSSSISGTSDSISVTSTPLKIGRSRALGLDLNRSPVPSPPGNPAKKKAVQYDVVGPDVFLDFSAVEPDKERNMDLSAMDDGGTAESHGSKRTERRKYTEEQKGKRKLFIEDADFESVLELRIGGMRDNADNPRSNGLAQEAVLKEESIIWREKVKEILVADNADNSRSTGLAMNIKEGDGMTNTSDKDESMFHLRIGGMNEEEFRAAFNQIQQETYRKITTESHRLRVVELAAEFAVIKPDREDENDDSEIEDSPEEEPEDWPGPFSTAMKIINDREKLLQARRTSGSSASSKFSELKIENLPSPNRETKFFNRQAPSLRELCLETLSEYASEIKSLEGVPDDLKNQLSRHLCNIRKMDEQMMDLFASGSPSEINIPDCSWATEDQLEKILDRTKTDRLAVLELNICGRCLCDNTLSSPRNLQPRFQALTRISLKGAYRLSDEGLKELTLSAPQLSCVDLGQCSRITSAGVNSLLERLQQSLVKVVLDDCGVDGASILAGLQRLEKLEALSVAGVEGVTDKFVRGLVSAHGARLTDLGFSGCRALTGASLKEIGKNCPQLRSVDLRDLVKLNDRALAHLASGCTSLRKVLFRRNPFSDKAMAAFVQAAGGALTELSVNNVKEVSNFTAQATATQCAFNLETLDVSFCRKMTNEGLGLIAGSCSRLLTLKLFGCTQISSTVLDDYSRGKLTVLGLEGPIIRHLRFPQSPSNKN